MMRQYQIIRLAQTGAPQAAGSEEHFAENCISHSLSQLRGQVHAAVEGIDLSYLYSLSDW